MLFTRFLKLNDVLTPLVSKIFLQCLLLVLRTLILTDSTTNLANLRSIYLFIEKSKVRWNLVHNGLMIDVLCRSVTMAQSERGESERLYDREGGWSWLACGQNLSANKEINGKLCCHSNINAQVIIICPWSGTHANHRESYTAVALVWVCALAQRDRTRTLLPSLNKQLITMGYWYG